jgi:hypothetical protein
MFGLPRKALLTFAPYDNRQPLVEKEQGWLVARMYVSAASW